MKIKVENLNKEFKSNIIVENINLEFESGNIYGLRGRNGSGKSVFLKLLCGLYIPTSGKIYYDDKVLSTNNIHEFNIGALIENTKFFNDLTGYQNVELLANIKKLIDKDKIEEILKLVNLYNEKDKKFGKYSLGMKQKLGIAQAIMENQNIIILDEPFNGIEENTVKKIKEYLLKEKEKDKIIIISSHIKDDLEDLCDKIYGFDSGKISGRTEHESD